jgi:hypothetical protein
MPFGTFVREEYTMSKKVRNALIFATVLSVLWLGPVYVLAKLHANDPPSGSNSIASKLQQVSAIPFIEFLGWSLLTWVGALVVGLVCFRKSDDDGS